jgi:hypothetical protein
MANISGPSPCNNKTIYVRRFRSGNAHTPYSGRRLISKPLRGIIFAGESARFAHPEQSLGITTMLGGIYRVAERADRAFASEWTLTSEKVPGATMMQHGVINHVVPDAELEQIAWKFAERAAKGPTRAYAAHKALLRVWAEGDVARRTPPCSTSRCRCSRRTMCDATTRRP